MKTRSFTISATPLGGRRVRFVASTPAVDSHGTRLHPRGCKLGRFKKAGYLPFLWAHRREGEPDDVLGRVVEVEITEAAVVCVVEFDDHPKALRCLRQVRRGFLRACSVGFVAEQEEVAADGVVDVLAWELCELSLCPIGSNPEALAVRSFTVTSRPRAAARAAATSFADRAAAPATPNRGTRMNPSEILAKLGLAEGATPEQIVDALLKYMGTSPDAAEAKALLTGLFAMLTPAASSASDGAAAAAAEAMADEVRKLQARIAELEAAKGEAEKKAEPTAEQRADEAIHDGRWLGSQRSALVAQFAANKTPYLFPAKTFSSRGVNFTEGGNPVKPDVKARLDAGADGAAGNLSELERGIVEMAQRNKLPISSKTFAAAKGR